MIEIVDFLDLAAVRLELASRTKADALEELAALLYEAYPRLSSELRLADAVALLAEREALAATGVGNGVAIPHAASERIQRLVGGFARSSEGIDFGAIDRRPCHLFVVLLCPSTDPKSRIKALSRISRALGSAERRAGLKAATTTEDVYRLLASTEAAASDAPSRGSV